MRKPALLWLVLAMLCGGVLFHTSQRVTGGRAELAKINDSLRREEESLRVLQAEWSYLNQPDRLEKLAQRHLALVPLRGSQFAKVAELEERPANAPAADNAADNAADDAAAAVAAAEKPARREEAKKEEPPAKAVRIAPAAQRPSPVFRPAPARPQRSASARNEKSAPAAEEQPRSFTDVMQSLGVR